MENEKKTHLFSAESLYERIMASKEEKETSGLVDAVIYPEDIDPSKQNPEFMKLVEEAKAHRKK